MYCDTRVARRLALEGPVCDELYAAFVEAQQEGMWRRVASQLGL